MTPLIERPEMVLAGLLLLLALIALLAGIIERRDWLRNSVRVNAEPWDDPRDKQTAFERELANNRSHR
jgi:hypothetical protein